MAEVRRRIGVGLLVVVALSAVWLATVTPSYTATSRIYLDSSSTDIASLAASGLYQSSQVQSLAALAHGSLVTTAAAREAHVDMSPQQLSDAITVAVVPQTVILEISVTDARRSRAVALARAVADEVVRQGDDLQQTGADAVGPVQLVVVDPATAPDHADRGLRGLVLTLLVGVLAALTVPSRWLTVPALRRRRTTAA